MFLIKIDTAGKAKWLKTIGGTGLDEAYGLAVDKFNNLYLGGRFQTSLKVGDSSLSNITSNFNYDAFIARLDTAGKYVWGRAFGGYAGSYQNLDYCYGVGVDNRGNIGISGRFGGTLAKFGKDTLSSGGFARAIYTSLLDSTGDFIWTIRGTSTTFWNNQANGIALDTSKNIYVTGIADPPLVFESKVFATGAGFRDAYVLKIADCSESIKAKIFSDSIISVCLGDSIKLWSNNNPNLEYRWLLGGGAFGIYLATDSTYKASKTDGYALAISDEGCLDTSKFIKVTINKPTKPTINTFPPACTGDPDFTITSGVPAGGKYSGIGVKNDTVFSPATSGIGSFNINYVYTDTNGCIDSTNKNLPVGGQSAFFTLVKSSACQNEATFAISGGNPSGGTYIGPGVTSGSFSPGSVSVGVHKLGYVYSALGCSDTAYQNITVNAAPAAGFSSEPIQCASTFSVSLAAYLSPVGGLLSGPGIIGTTFYPIISGAGNFTITYITAGSCKDTATRVITVEPVPLATLTAFSNRCADASAFALTGGGSAGGVYLYNGNAVTSFNPIAVGAGTYTIKYAFTNNCGTDTASRTIKIDSLPTVTLSALPAVCAGSPAFALTGGSPAGGTYSGPGVNSTTGIFTPGTATAGSHAITYSFTDGNSCSNTATQNIVVNAQPIVTLGNFTDVCIDNGLVSLTTGLPTPEVYSGTGVTGTNFNPLTATSGTHTITYKHTDGNSCTDSASKTIVVNALPVVSLTGLSPVCVNASSVTLSGGSPTGGTFSGSGVNSTTGIFTPLTAGIGTHKITYTYSDAKGCSDTASQTITVNGLPTVTLSALPAVCAGSPAFALAGGSPASGAYSGTAVNSTTGTFTPGTATAGTHAITYSFTDGNSCSNTATQNIVVNAQPIVTLGNLANICANASSLILSGGLPLTASFSGRGVSSGSFNPSVAGRGTHLITYKYIDANNCTDSASKSIVVDSITTLTYPILTNICGGSARKTINLASPIGGIYKGIGVVNDTLFDPSISGTGTFTIRYVFTNNFGCKDSINQTMGVDTKPSVLFTVQDSLCANNDSLTLIGVPTGGMFSGTGVKGNKFGLTGLSGIVNINYLYTDPNGCSNNILDSIRVDTVSKVSFSLLDSMCFGASVVSLSATPVGGNYSLNGNVYSNSTYSGMVANSIDTISYRFINAFGCADSTFEYVRIDSVTSVSLASFGSICEDDTLNLTVGSPAGGVYSGSGVIGSRFVSDTSGIWKITYTLTNQFGCVDSLDSNIIVRAKPKLAFGTVGLICANTIDFKLKAGNPLGGVYSGAGIVNDTIFSPNLVGKGMHAFTYTLKDTNACVDSIKFTLTVDTVPVLGLDTFACRNQGLVNLSGGTPAGGFYYGTNVIGTNQFDPSFGFGTRQIGYTFIDGKGCQDSLIKPIYVDTLPKITSAAIEDICQNVGLIDLTKGNPTGGVYKGRGIQLDGQFNPKSVSLGLDSLYYVLESRCGIDSMKVMFNVLDAPKASLPPYGRICNAQEGLALTQGKPSGGLYFVDGIEASTLSSRPGTVDIQYVLSNSTGCSDTASSNAQYYSNPEITVVGDKAVCAGDSARFRVKENLATYIWNGDTASAEYFLKAEDMILGENVVKLMAIDSLGCSSEMSVKVNSTLCGFSVKARPNPNNGRFVLEINSGMEQEIDIAIWNTHGQRISGFNTVLIAGKNEFLYNMLDSAPGMYILEILIGQDLVIEKFVIK